MRVCVCGVLVVVVIHDMLLVDLYIYIHVNHSRICVFILRLNCIYMYIHFTATECVEADHSQAVYSMMYVGMMCTMCTHILRS